MIKHLKTAIVTAALMLPLIAHAQNCSYNYLGTKTLYTAASNKPTPAPAGYQPVFINYVGRHGARHLTKEVSTSYAYTVLMRADSLKSLTSAGKKLRLMVLALDKVERGQVKSISAEGRDELQGIGRRMFKSNPQVFNGDVKLNVGITKEIRTKQSADAFLTGLKDGFKGAPKISEYTDDTNLRFYDASPAYTAFEENGSWQADMDKLKQRVKLTAVNQKIAKDWLSPTYIKTLKPEEIEKLVSDVFGFATITASLKAEIQQAGVKPGEVSFESLFSCSELLALSRIDITDDYLKKGPGMDNNGIQVKIAAPLLVNFINTTDAFIKNAPVNAELRFAHAETISPFATLLGITKADKVTKDIYNVGGVWWSSEIIPLSANIQWIFYRKDNGSDLLVKVLLNEQEVKINGMPVNKSPYYKWTELRAFYISKLAKLDVKPDDDMKAYLKNVK